MSERGSVSAVSPASLDAHLRLPGTISGCSWRASWRSLLLRAYDESGTVQEFTTSPTPDQLIVLTTKGSYPVEIRHGSGWRKAHSHVGTLGMTSAGQDATLRWRNGTPVSTLQLHVPRQTMQAASEALWDRELRSADLPNAFTCEDPLVQRLMLELAGALSEGAPDIYAETAAAYLAVHLLRRHSPLAEPMGAVSARHHVVEERRVRRAEHYMRENLEKPITLDTLAGEAGLSRFHFLRLFKRTYGDTPFRWLTRLRIERACFMLHAGDAQVTQVAFRCGFESPSHFAAAFRRATGTSPSGYRDNGPRRSSGVPKR